jgi:hypothetical protein
VTIYFTLIHSKLFFGNLLFSIHRVYQNGPKISLLIHVPISLQLSSRNISHNNIPGIEYSIRFDRSLGLHKAQRKVSSLAITISSRHYSLGRLSRSQLNSTTISQLVRISEQILRLMVTKITTDSCSFAIERLNSTNNHNKLACHIL